MGDAASIKLYAETLRIHQVDGSDVMTEAKKLALLQILDYYESAALDEINENDSLRTVMEQNFVRFYKILEGLHPEKQVVFVDTSRFEKFYKKNFQVYIKQDLFNWSRNLVSILNKLYRLPSGEELNIDFTTTKPTSGSFLTVAITQQDFDSFMYSNEDSKVQLVYSLLYGDCGSHSDRGEKVRRIVERVTKQYGRTTGERRKMIAVSEDPEFKKLVPKGGYARYAAKSDNEFGNEITEGLIWVGAHRFLETFEDSLNVLKGTSLVQGTFIPWLGMNEGENIVKGFAEVVAHEIGHALGLSHPSKGLGCFDDRTVSMVPKRRPHLMDQTVACDRERPNLCYFTDSAQDYLKYILGVRKSP